MSFTSFRKKTKRIVASLVSAIMVFSWVFEGGTGTMIASAEEAAENEPVIEVVEETVTDSEADVPEENVEVPDEIVSSSEGTAFTHNGKKVVSVSLTVPYSTLYTGVDSFYQSRVANRYELVYEDGSSDYLYLTYYGDNTLLSISDGSVVDSDIYHNDLYLVRVDADAYYDYVDEAGNKYVNILGNQIYSIMAEGGTYYVLSRLYQNIDDVKVYYQRDIFFEVNVVDPSTAEGVKALNIGEMTQLTDNNIYSETDYFVYQNIYKINGAREGYEYSYWETFNREERNCWRGVQLYNTNFRLSNYRGDSNFSIKICENLPITSVEYCTTADTDKLVYYVGAHGCNIYDANAGFYDVFRNKSLYKITFSDGSTYIYNYNDDGRVDSNLPCDMSISIYDSANNYVNFDGNALSAGNYTYRLWPSFYHDSNGTPICLTIPFEVRAFSDLANDAIELKKDSTVYINKYKKNGGYAYLKMNLEAGNIYTLSTANGNFSSVLYDSDGYAINSINTNGVIEVSKSGQYYLVINYAYFDDDQQDIKITLKEKPTIVKVELNTSVAYRNRQYLGLYTDFSDHYRPVGAEFTVTFSDNSTQTYVLSSSTEEYYDFYGNYVGEEYLVDSSYKKVSYDSLTKAGTYYYRIEFVNSTVVLDIPVNVLDSKQIDTLAINDKTTLQSAVNVLSSEGVESTNGSPTVYAVSLEAGKSYRFMTDNYISAYITLYDTEWNELVGLNKVYYDEDNYYVNSSDRMNYSCEKTGTYYVCIITWADTLYFHFEETNPITKVEFDSSHHYRDTYFVGTSEDFTFMPAGAKLKITYADNTVESIICNSYFSYDSAMSSCYIVDSEYNRLYNMPTEAGDYYYEISFDGYKTPIYIPLTVKDFSSSSIETVEEGMTGVRIHPDMVETWMGSYLLASPAVYKVSLAADKNYYFSVDDIFYQYASVAIYDAEGTMKTNGKSVVRQPSGTYSEQVGKYTYKPDTAGTYYVVISSDMNRDFTFYYCEVPDIASVAIASQPYITEYYSGFDEIKDKYYLGLSLRINFDDETSITAYINDFAKYGITTAIVDETGNVVWRECDDELYGYSFTKGTYRVKIVVGDSDIVLYSNELHVNNPVYESISIGESKAVSANAFEMLFGLSSDEYRKYNIGTDKLIKVSLETDKTYKFSLDKYNKAKLTLYDQQFSYVAYSEGDLYYRGTSGTYYIAVSTYEDVTLSISTESEISKIEVTKQPSCVSTGISVIDNMSSYYFPLGMELKVTYKDGHTVNTTYGDNLWNTLIAHTDIVSTTGKVYGYYGWYSDRTYVSFSNSDTVKFVLTINESMLADAVIESASIAVTTDLLINSKYMLNKKNTAANPVTFDIYDGEEAFYTINCEKGKSYMITIDGASAQLLLVTHTDAGSEYKSVGEIADAVNTTGYLAFDGISAEEGTYCLWISRDSDGFDYEKNSSANVKITLTERNVELIKYEGMSMTLENGMARVNAYFTLDEAYANLTRGWYDYADEMVPVKDTITVNGVSKSVYRFSAYISADNLNEKGTLFIQINDSVIYRRDLSVAQYVQEILENKNNKAEYTKAQPLLNALVNYGQYMEEYFATGSFDKVRFNTLAKTNRAGSDEAIAKISTAAPSYKNSSSFTYLGCSLALHQATTINMYFENKTTATDSDALLAKYNVYVNGVIASDEVDISFGNGYIVITYYDIDIQDLDKAVTVEIVGKSNASDKASASYSPMNYISTVLNNSSKYSTKLVKLCRAMYFYMDEAKKYKAA